MSETSTITVTEHDIARVAAKIESADVLPDEDMTVLRAIFLLAGHAVSDADVEGFMPIYMHLGDIKGDAMSLNFTRSALGGNLLGSFQQGAHGAGGGGGAGKAAN